MVRRKFICGQVLSAAVRGPPVVRQFLLAAVRLPAHVQSHRACWGANPRLLHLLSCHRLLDRMPSDSVGSGLVLPGFTGIKSFTFWGRNLCNGHLILTLESGKRRRIRLRLKHVSGCCGTSCLVQQWRIQTGLKQVELVIFCASPFPIPQLSPAQQVTISYIALASLHEMFT